MRKKIAQFIRFTRFLIPFWDKQALIISAGLGLNLLALTSPLLMKLMVDYAFLNRDFYIFKLIFLAIIILYIFSTLIKMIQQYLATYVRNLLTFNLRAHFYAHFNRLSLRFFQSRSTGEHLYRLGADVDGAATLSIETIPILINSLVRVPLLLLICLWLDWKLTLVAIGVVPIFYLHAHYFAKKYYAINKKMIEQSQDITSGLQDAISQAKLLQIFFKGRVELNRYRRDLIAQMKLIFRSFRIGLVGTESSSFLNTALVLGMTYYCGLQVISGNLSLGSFTALTIYLFQLLNLLRSFGDLYRDTMVRFVSLERLEQTLDVPIEVKDKEHAISLVSLKGDIEFRGVSFGYNPERLLFEEMNLVINGGSTVAITGNFGVGKTTMLNLILRLYDPLKGSILLDGHDLRDLTVKSIRDRMGVVIQETFLLRTTIEENIRFGNPQTNHNQIEEICQFIGIHDFIMRLPKGYDTDIGERGSQLSQGQRHSISIVRALLRNPDILMIDEVIYFLGPNKEVEILNKLRHWKPRMTIIVVSQRISDVSDLDKIIVIGNKKIEEIASFGKGPLKEGLQVGRPATLSC